MEDGGGEGNGVVEFRNCGWPHSPVHSANELNYVLNGQLETTTHTHTHTHTYTHTHTHTHVHTYTLVYISARNPLDHQTIVQPLTRYQ